ncbi:MAG: PAS domain S-box protein [Chloroflexi bacterium]|nr:PAS domain S-box protein [Chloroflexota bacterium]
MDNAADTMVCVDREAHFIDVNDTFCRACGYSREELLSMRVHDLDPDYSAELWPEFWEKLKKSGSLIFETCHRSKEGELYPVEISARYFEHDGKEYHTAVARDITERKKSEEALEASEAKYRLLADNVRDQVWVMDLNLKPTYISPSVEKLRGYTLEELAQLPLDKQFTATSFQSAMEFFSIEMPKAEADPEYFARPLELEWCCKDGSTLWVESTFSQVRGENGEPMSLMGVGRDITERKRAEDEVKRQQAFLRQVIDGNPNLIFVKDRDSRYLLANNALANAYGTTSANMQGKTDLELGVPAEEFARFRQDDMEVLQSGKEKIIPDESFTWHSGEVHYYQTTKRPLLNEKGEINSILVVSVDITNRKKAEVALKASEAQYRLLAEHTTDGIMLLDMNLKLTYVSPNVEKMRGFTPLEAMGMSLEKHLTPGSLKLASELFLEEIPKVEADPDYNPVRILELEYCCKDGATILTESKFSIIRDPGGKPVSILGEARDITERKKAETALRRSEEKYRLLADNASDVIWTADMNLNTTYISPSIYAMQGHTPEEAMNLTMEQRFTPESLEKLSKIFMEALANEEAGREQPNNLDIIEAEYIRKDGSTYGPAS